MVPLRTCPQTQRRMLSWLCEGDGQGGPSFGIHCKSPHVVVIKIEFINVCVEIILVYIAFKIAVLHRILIFVCMCCFQTLLS